MSIILTMLLHKLCPWETQGDRRGSSKWAGYAEKENISKIFTLYSISVSSKDTKETYDITNECSSVVVCVSYHLISHHV